jgi:hypothetical protein
MNDVRATLDADTTNHTVANTATRTAIYSFLVEGGTLNDDDSVLYEGQGYISFIGANSLTLEMEYGGSVVAECTVAVNSGGNTKALFIDARLSADGSVNSQNGFIRSTLGVPVGQDASIPIGFGSVGESSNGDQLFEIYATWNAASLSNTVTIAYQTLEHIGFSENTSLPELEEPTACIFISSKLNKLRYNLRKDAYVYIPLEHDLAGLCYGAVTFTRGSTSTATWRDGVAHAVAANKGRFEYSGDDALGLAINTGTETLSLDSDNLLGDSNTLCWNRDGIFKSTPSTANPFSTMSIYTGTSGVHISHITKFNRILTAAEIAEIETALT